MTDPGRTEGRIGSEQHAGGELFRRCNLYRLPLRPHVAHDGLGEVNAIRIATSETVSGACNFIDYVEVPPGASIGDHRHARDEEEWYLVLSGEGEMRLDDERFTVTAGDLVRNRPGGLHGLSNSGDLALRLFVVELSVP